MRLTRSLFLKNTNTGASLKQNKAGFAGETLVLVENGYKPFKDLSLEDKLLSSKGVFVKILKIHKSKFTGVLYKIHFKYHPKAVVCAGEQLFMGEKGLWLPVSEYQSGKFACFSINQKLAVPSFTFEKGLNHKKKVPQTVVLDKESQWWMLGLFVGDGWVLDTMRNGVCRNEICFAIADKQEAFIVPKLLEVLPVKNRQVDSGASKRYGCSDFFWHKVLKQFGKYAHGKYLPEWVHDADPKLLKAFCAGYETADGYLQPDRNSGSVSSVAPSLAFGIQRIYLKLGSIAHISRVSVPEGYIMRGKVVQRQPFLYTTGRCLEPTRRLQARIKGDLVYYPVPTKSKKESGISTLQVEDFDLYQLEVEGDGSFTVENLIVKDSR